MPQMPTSATVTVADILELRADGLTEEETWALLCQAAQTLQDLFLSDELSAREVVPMVSPYTLAISSKGRVVISFVCGVQLHDEPYLAPEYTAQEKRTWNSLDWEKMWVYSLGKTLLSALKDTLRTESLNLLKFMTAKDSGARASLMSLLNIISEHCQTHLPVKPFSHLLMEIYKEVFGAPPQCLLPPHVSPLTSVSPAEAPCFAQSSAIERERHSSNPEGNALSRSSSRAGSSDSRISNSSCCCPTKRNPVQRAPSRLYRGPSVTDEHQLLPGACIGPEFVVRGMEPPRVVHVGNAKASQRRALTVILLTGQRLRVTCDPHAITCSKLFEILVQVEDIEDNYIFGLASVINGEFVFVPGEVKLHKVAPPGWKDDGKEFTSSRFFLYVRVKFFLPNPRGFKSARTKHLMYLQLRRSLLEQQIKCELEELLALGGLALQAEFGDYSVKEHGTSSYFLLDHYLPEEVLDGRTELEARLQDQHKSRLGLEPGLAEEVFVAQVQRLPEYGSHHHTALWMRKSVNIPMWVTVNPHGVYLYEKKKNVLDRKIHAAFVWKNIQGLSCTETYFRLAPHGDLGQKAACYKLRMEGRKSFFLFRLAAFHHQFFLKLRIELKPLHALSQEFGVRLKKDARNGFCLEKRAEAQALRSGRRTSRPYGNAEDQENKENEGLMEKKREKRSGVRMGVSTFHGTDVRESPDAYVIEASIRSSGEQFAYELQESLSSGLGRQWAEVSWAEERALRKVRLTKDKYGSFGLEIVEGGGGGVFVETVLKHGEGESVLRGDQLLSVNGICLLNLNYSEALAVLKNAGNEMEILVSRSCGGGCERKPLEHEYLKSIRYETANEAENLACEIGLAEGFL